MASPVRQSLRSSQETATSPTTFTPDANVEGSSFGNGLLAFTSNLFSSSKSFETLDVTSVQKLKMHYVNGLSKTHFVSIPAEHFSKAQVQHLGDTQLSYLVDNNTIAKIVDYLNPDKLFDILNNTSIDKVKCLQRISPATLEDLLQWGEVNSERKVRTVLLDLFKGNFSALLPMWQRNVEQVTYVRVHRLMLSVLGQCAVGHDMVKGIKSPLLTDLFSHRDDFEPTEDFVRMLEQEQVIGLCEAALNDRTQGPLLLTVSMMLQHLPDDDPRLRALGAHLRLKLNTLTDDQFVYVMCQPKLAPFLFPTLNIGRFKILLNRIIDITVKAHVLSQAVKHASPNITDGYFHELAELTKILEQMAPLSAKSIMRLIRSEQGFELAKKMNVESLIRATPHANVARVAIFLLDTIPAMVPQAWFDKGADCMSPEQMQDAFKKWNPLPADKIVKGLNAILQGDHPRSNEQFMTVLQSLKTELEMKELIDVYFKQSTKDTFSTLLVAAMVLYFSECCHFFLMQQLLGFMYRKKMARIDYLPTIFKEALLMNRTNDQNMISFIKLLTTYGCLSAEILPDFSQDTENLIFNASSQQVINWWLNDLKEKFTNGIQDKISNINKLKASLEEKANKKDPITPEEADHITRTLVELASQYFPLQFYFTMQQVLANSENLFLGKSLVTWLLFPLGTYFFKATFRILTQFQVQNLNEKIDPNQLREALRLNERESYEEDVWSMFQNAGIDLTHSMMRYEGKIYVDDIKKIHALGVTTREDLIRLGLHFPGEPIMHVLLRLEETIKRRDALIVRKD